MDDDSPPLSAPRRRLVQRIERFLDRVDVARCNLTPWEGFHVLEALRDLERGHYLLGQDAMMRAENAETFRQAGWTCPDVPRFVEELREALRRAAGG
jgi:hypothetical protein